MEPAEVARLADEAGRYAADTLEVRPAYLSQPRRIERLDSGPRGYAWIWITGNNKFVHWARNSGLSRPARPKGARIDVTLYGQSLARKRAYAIAYAGVLRAHGVPASAEHAPA